MWRDSLSTPGVNTWCQQSGSSDARPRPATQALQAKIQDAVAAKDYTQAEKLHDKLVALRLTPLQKVVRRYSCWGEEMESDSDNEDNGELNFELVPESVLAQTLGDRDLERN